jgi:hypothetical protein
MVCGVVVEHDFAARRQYPAGRLMAVTTASWQGAASAQPPLAAQVNQLLGVHKSQNLYAAVQTAGQTTNGSASTSSNNLWLAQSFSTAGGQTAIGYVIAPVTTTTASGAGLTPTTLSLYANSAGAPSGAALVSTTLTAEYANLASGGTATTRLIYPLPVAGLTASTTYWLVLHSTASSGSYTWFRSNQVSGASTSTNGTAWTGQGYGFVYQVFDQTASGLLTCTWEDSGARWSALTYGTTGVLASTAEYTVAQGANAYVQSYRALTYTNGLLTKVS